MSDTPTVRALDELFHALEVALSNLDPALAGTLLPIVRALEARSAELNHRLDLLELAVRGLIYEPVDEEPDPAAVAGGQKTTVFGIPVELVGDHTAADVITAVERLPKGLDGEAVVDELVTAGYLTREV